MNGLICNCCVIIPDKNTPFIHFFFFKFKPERTRLIGISAWYHIKRLFLFSKPPGSSRKSVVKWCLWTFRVGPLEKSLKNRMLSDCSINGFDQFWKEMSEQFNCYRDSARQSTIITLKNKIKLKKSQARENIFSFCFKSTSESLKKTIRPVSIMKLTVK